MVPITCRAVVMDIEGTTSAARHVYDVLFPYARRQLPAWISDHGDEPVTAGAVREVADQLGVSIDEVDAVVEQLQSWIDQDVKAAPLKALQGLIWEQGYSKGELTSHMFDDVPPALHEWHSAGIPLVIYSSGSVAAQHALFANAEQGDLDALIDDNFDITTAGPKREAHSYERIAQQLGIPGPGLVFLSDVQAELDAASEAGWQTVGVLRAGEEQATVAQELRVASFTDLEIRLG
ncbi:MAG: acireductone synthase [Candidatus Nanopelagicales bacterium]|nr:acireductone synthase [Candidatus Nanopelagicales bacterium]MCF8543616.1 acireductone synthase [Candidatus Nanopelagicales bacterium]